jgi:integrase
MADGILLPASYHVINGRPAIGMTFADAAASYLTAGGEGRYLPPIIDHFRGRTLDSIHPYDIRLMAETLFPSQSGATRNRQAVTPARAVMLHAYDRGWAPLMRIRRFKEDRPKRRRPASMLWLHLLCRQCDRDKLPHLAALVLTMATTGARISEAIALRWSEVDLTGRKLVLLRTKTSRNSERSLTDDVAERLRKLQADRKPDDRVFHYTARYSVNERLKAVCKRAGISYKSPHLCGRHTFATTAIELGVDIGTAMAAGDWRSEKVFLGTYFHPRQNAGRAVADRFSAHSFTEL